MGMGIVLVPYVKFCTRADGEKTAEMILIFYCISIIPLLLLMKIVDLLDKINKSLKHDDRCVVKHMVTI